MAVGQRKSHPAQPESSLAHPSGGFYHAGMASTVPEAIERLIARFNDNADHYRSAAYNETLCRVDFINPMFKCLGWDMDNEKGYADAYRDVIHEDAIKIGSATKAPDYCFRIGGTRKFFLEAKKPGVDLKNNPEPAYQLRRYAWSAKLPLSILTDFQEFAVYDCRFRPDQTDKAPKGRIFYCTYDQYIEKWAEIASIFARESILKGSFDRFAETARGKRGTAEVDAAFLKEIEGWREALAKNIALRNELSQRDLNFAVQRTIDRIIFLRICEDRGIEQYNQLGAIANGPNVYARLRELYNRADERYNSGIFHFRPEKGRNEAPDELTPGLTIDDKVLRDIIRTLYYPQSPYEFSVITADILGQVYEQFLGKVIVLSPSGRRAAVEEKPEVRKAGGVYYTPTYIVDYIVQNTVGRLLGRGTGECGTGVSPVEGCGTGVPPVDRGAGTPPASVAATPRGGREPDASAAGSRSMTPKEAAKLRILDPACGSGSFLIGAYQFLLDWHLDWYTRNDPDKWLKGRNPAIYEVVRPRGGTDTQLFDRPARSFRLTIAKRKEILTNNIYGVDIDPQAVEVTKLSLLLKVLEGETGETIGQTLRLFHERALPDLGNNIKCGNSLIGPDFYDNQQMMLLPDDERLRINVFDWNREFPDIMKAGGFDAVIGNPPYVRQEALRDIKGYLSRRYAAFDSTADLYVYFIERAVSLLRGEGLHSFIVSSGFLRTNFGRALREHVMRNAALLELVDFGGLPVFEAAKDTYVCIPLIGRPPQPESVSVCKISSLERTDLTSLVPTRRYAVPMRRFAADGWATDPDHIRRVFDKLTPSTVPLGQYVQGRIYRGVLTGLNEAFEIDPPTREKLFGECLAADVLIRPFLGGQDIRRYAIRAVERYLIAIPCGWTREAMRTAGDRFAEITEKAAWAWMREHYAAISDHLSPYEAAARKRQDKGEFWWELRPCDYYDVLDGPKIIYPDITKQPRFYLDMGRTYIRNTAYCLGTDDRYLLGILNSRLAWFAIGRISIPFGTRAGEFRYRMFTQYVEQIPIHSVDMSNRLEKAKHDQMVSLVDQMLALHKRLATTTPGHARDTLQRQIDATNAQIDRLVYELYGLMEESIRIIEEATAKNEVW